MNRINLAVAVAVVTFGITATAWADQGIPVLPANPVMSQTMITGGGEQYPTFATQGAPVVSERVLADNGGQTYPTFVNPTNGGTRADYAAIGTVNGANAQYASLTGFKHNGG